MSRALAISLLIAATSLAQTRASRCWSACARNVADPRTRASACGACLIHPEDAAAWLASAQVPLEALLRDPDWQVRWSALEHAHPASPQLARASAQWVARTPAAACLTVLHGAGRRRTSLSAFLAEHPAAARSCTAQLPALVSALHLELYDENASLRLDALKEGSAGLAVSPGRLLLDAVPGHPPGFDSLLLEALSEVALTSRATAPAMLIEAATQGDVELMNRLLGVYGLQRDAAKAALDGHDPLRRKEAILTLASLAPLSDAELLAALDDTDLSIRRSAAIGLGRGLATGHHPIAAAARAFLLEGREASPAQRLTLLSLMRDANERECGDVARAVWRQPGAPPELRRRALPAAASCDWPSTTAEVETVLRTQSGGPTLAAAVAALGFAPHAEQLFERLSYALRHPDAEVRAAACEAAAQAQWRAARDRVVLLAHDASAEVRLAAIDSAVALEAPRFESHLTQLLEADGSVAVRALAARRLGDYKGPKVSATLSAAARNDVDPHVKLEAAESLRRLGVGSPAP